MRRSAAVVKHNRNVVKSMASERAKREEANQKDEDKKLKAIRHALEISPEEVVDAKFR